MNTTMKITSIAFLIGFGFVQQACQQPTELAENKPAIKAISFVGIPPQNVHFDAPNATITVQLPAILKGGLQPIFDLTDGARVLDGLLADNTVDLTSYCHCTSSGSKDITLRVGNQTTTSVYKLNVVATGSLKAQNSDAQFTFSRKTKLLEMSLPVENLYTNPRITDLTFTNVATGVAAHINADAACLNSCKSMAPNQLMFTISSPIETYLVPGTYTIAIGTINFPQRLVVTD